MTLISGIISLKLDKGNTVKQLETIEKAGLNISEACLLLGGISRPTLYRLINQRKFRSYKIGSRRFILRSDLLRYIENQVEEEG